MYVPSPTSPSLTSHVQTVTPEPFSVRFERIDAVRAQEILANHYTSNRKVNLQRVRGYRDEMLNGWWTTTHQGVAIDTEGHLLDGQHRLRAIIEADQVQPGFSVVMLVSEGVSPDVFWMMDTGFGRNAQSWLEGTQKNERTALVRTLMMLSENKGIAHIRYAGRGNYPPHHILRFVHEHEVLQEYTKIQVVPTKKADFPGTSAAGLYIGGFMAGVSGTGPNFDYAPETWERWWHDVKEIKSKNGLAEGNPVKALSRCSHVSGNATSVAYMRAIFAGVRYRTFSEIVPSTHVHMIRLNSIQKVQVW